MAGVTAPIVTNDVVTNSVVTSGQVTGGGGVAPSGNTLVDTILALSPSSLWQMNEASGVLADSGSSSFPLNFASTNNENYQLPGLAQGAPRVYGAWEISGFNYGNPIRNSGGAYDGSAWTTGGIGVFCLISSNFTTQHVVSHHWDGQSTRYLTISVAQNGTITARTQFNGTIRVDASTASGVFQFGKRAFLYCQQDGVNGLKLYYNGVEVATTVTFGGTGVTANSFVADMATASGAPFAAANGTIFVGNNSSGTAVTTVLTSIYSLPMMFYNTVLTADEILSIWQAAGYANSHDDYLEFMIDRVGEAKLYHPCLNSYGISTSIIPLITNTAESTGNPRFQGGVPGAIEDDTLITATAYPKKQWDLSASDADAYLRNWTTEVPFVETGDPGTTGTWSITVVVKEISPASLRYYFDYDDGVTSYIRLYVDTNNRLYWLAQISGTVQWRGYLSGLAVDDRLTFTVVQDGTGYALYLNGVDRTGDFTVEVGTDDTVWFGNVAVGLAQTSYVYKFVFDDFDKQAHEFFYLDGIVWTPTQVLEHFNAQNGSFP